MVNVISPSELAALLASEPNLDVVDVRDPEEWVGGHIDGARLVPLEVLREDPDAELVHGKPVVFVCAKGVRALQAAKLADRFGYERVFTLDGGVAAWTRDGRALVLETRTAAS